MPHNKKSPNVDYQISIEDHSGIGSRFKSDYLNLVLDLSFIADTLCQKSTFYTNINLEGEDALFDYEYNNYEIFYRGSFYADADLKLYTSRTLKEYETNFRVDSVVTGKYDISSPNVYQIYRFSDNQNSYSSWEFFFTIADKGTFRLTCSGKLPRMDMYYSELNGKNQISTLLENNNQFIFDPQGFILKSLIDSDFDPTEAIEMIESHLNKLTYKQKTEACEILSFCYSLNFDNQTSTEIMRKYSEPEFDISEILSLIDAVNYEPENTILKKSRQVEIFHFNENHYFPYNRSFLRSLLTDLYNQDYRILCLEAITISSDSYTQVKDLDEAKGFYCAEPEFQKLLKTAFDLGYKVFSYENVNQINSSPLNSIQLESLRDSLASINIMSIFDQERSMRKEKMLILSGHHHVYKSTEYGVKRLAYYLNRHFGDNYCSLDQSIIPEWHPHIFSNLEFYDEEKSVIISYKNAPVDFRVLHKSIYSQ